MPYFNISKCPCCLLWGNFISSIYPFEPNVRCRLWAGPGLVNCLPHLTRLWTLELKSPWFVKSPQCKNQQQCLGQLTREFILARLYYSFIEAFKNIFLYFIHHFYLLSEGRLLRVSSLPRVFRPPHFSYALLYPTSFHFQYLFHLLNLNFKYLFCGPHPPSFECL